MHHIVTFDLNHMAGNLYSPQALNYQLSKKLKGEVFHSNSETMDPLCTGPIAPNVLCIFSLKRERMPY